MDLILMDCRVQGPLRLGLCDVWFLSVFLCDDGLDVLVVVGRLCSCSCTIPWPVCCCCCCLVVFTVEPTPRVGKKVGGVNEPTLCCD